MDNKIVRSPETGTAEPLPRLSRRSGRFLKGPIPLLDIQTAIACGGKSINLYLAIVHRSDLLGRGKWISLPPHFLEGFGIRKNAKSRDLRAIAAAGLIELQPYAPGLTARVKLVEE